MCNSRFGQRAEKRTTILPPDATTRCRQVPLMRPPPRARGPRGAGAGVGASIRPQRSRSLPFLLPPCAAAVPSPPPSLDLRDTTLSTIRTLIQARWPALLDLVDAGVLIAAPHPPDYAERRSDGYVEPRLVLLIATVHVSTASARAVERVIAATRPQAVVVELCKSRSGLVREVEEGDEDTAAPQPPTTNPFSLSGSLTRTLRLSGGNPASLLLRLLLARAAASVAASVDGAVAPGADARAAAAAARAVDATIVLGDRPIEITLKRVWEGTSLAHKFAVLRVLATTQGPVAGTPPHDLTSVAAVEALASDPASLASIAASLQQVAPPLHAALLTKRDEWIAWSLARSRAVSGANVVVGVLGASHVRGVAWHLLHRPDRPRFQDLAGVRDGDARRVAARVGVETVVWGLATAAAAAAFLM